MMHKTNLYPYYKLFDEAPMAAAIIHADSFKLEMANEPMLKLWGRTSGVIGTPLLEFLPEIAEQSYPYYLRWVCKTGTPHDEKGAKVLLHRWGKRESVYMDYSYTPIFGEGEKPTGLLILATDVCERELGKLITQQSSRDLRALVLSAPIAMCIYRGEKFKVEAVNELMLDIWQDTQQMNLSALNYVFYNGVPYSFTDSNIVYTYTPLGHGIAEVAGVCVVAVRQ